MDDQSKKKKKKKGLHKKRTHQVKESPTDAIA